MRITISGPQGCGKENVSRLLRELLPDHKVIDEWDGFDPLPDNCIVTTNVYLKTEHA